ncbi:hypothetical protein BURPS668_A3072 [Burkholderia pseudomallei 668]|nr:hypothetical protein BURPS668_A3072 [Burkholderia pseudomallei 668]
MARNFKGNGRGQRTAAEPARHRSTRGPRRRRRGLSSTGVPRDATRPRPEPSAFRMSDNLCRTDLSSDAAAAVERVYREWDRAWAADDLDAMIALYAPDAVLESPLVTHLLGTESGVVEGRERIRALLEQAAPRKPEARMFHRIGYFTDGKRLIWEYPRATPTGEQMDFVEMMEIEHGLIRRHRVYWGWRGVSVIKADAYRKGRR